MNSLLRLQGDYGLPTFVTENGGLYGDGPGSDAFGADVRGYCHWSLLDNFEWALGYYAGVIEAQKG